MEPSQLFAGFRNVSRDSFDLIKCIGGGGFGRVHLGVFKMPHASTQALTQSQGPASPSEAHPFAGGEVAVSQGEDLSSSTTSEGQVELPIAVKELSITQESDRDQQQQIERSSHEAAILAECAHINICQLMGACYEPPFYYLLMEYAAGGALNRLLADISLEPRVIVDWATQIARGLNYLHNECAAGCVVHRDLKSANILLSKVDANGKPKLLDNVIKIADFGLARHFHESVELSRPGGTFAWMAPEVIKTNLFSRGADVWSFGVVLWELLTSQVPYAGINMYSVAYSVGLKGSTLPIPTDCPYIYAQLLRDCWEVDPHSRPGFQDILVRLHTLQQSGFLQTGVDEFFSLQQAWRDECRVKFKELQRTEQEIELQMAELHREKEQQTLVKEQLNAKEQELNERERQLRAREYLIHTSTPKEPLRRPSRHKKRLTKEDISQPSDFVLLTRDYDPDMARETEHRIATATPIQQPASLPTSPNVPTVSPLSTLDDLFFFGPQEHDEPRDPPPRQKRSNSADRYPKRLFSFKKRLGRTRSQDCVTPPGPAQPPSPRPSELPQWFQPTLTKKEVEAKLAGREAGTFMIRRSKSQTDKFVMTVVLKDSSLRHFLIYTDTTKRTLRLSQKSPMEFSSVDSMLTHYSNFPFTKDTTDEWCYLSYRCTRRKKTKASLHQRCRSQSEGQLERLLLTANEQEATAIGAATVPTAPDSADAAV
eukprot:m.91908 g.91908  ORF g.91908 m.91908 type:complete len:711 (+) comp12967_c0_seq3:246-2378(+)